MRRAWLLAILLGTGGFNFLRGPDEDVQKGNEAFAGGRYEEALGHYDAALARGEDPRVHYDKGTALYKMGEQAKDAAQKAELMQRAEEEFGRAAAFLLSPASPAFVTDSQSWVTPKRCRSTQ